MQRNRNRFLEAINLLARLFIILPIKWFIVLPIIVTTALLVAFVESFWTLGVIIGFLVGIVLIPVFGLGIVVIIICLIGLLVTMLLWWLTTALLQLAGFVYNHM